MAEGSNPVVPAGWEVSILALGALHLALVVAAVVTLARDKAVAPPVKLVYLLAILAFPLLGPAAWFLQLYRTRRGAGSQARRL